MLNGLRKKKKERKKNDTWDGKNKIKEELDKRHGWWE
jgi:hypothetical protein